MPEFTVRNIAFTVLIAAALAALLGAVALLASQDDNAPVQVIAPATSPPDAASPAEVRVYVNGAVHNPGVYTLASDSRITDALAAAGGTTEDGVLDGLNLALRVTDEAQYYVRKSGEPPPTASNDSPANANPGAVNGGLIDINLATVEMLDTLPGIGPVLAQAIIDYRENVRPFQSTAEIQEVPKIGPGTFAEISGLITVTGGP